MNTWIKDTSPTKELVITREWVTHFTTISASEYTGQAAESVEQVKGALPFLHDPGNVGNFGRVGWKSQKEKNIFGSEPFSIQ
jgi:hypothetical protein